MSEFLDYYHGTSGNKKSEVVSEETKLAMFKQGNKQASRVAPKVDDDDDFYDEELERAPIREARRVMPKVRPRPRPIEQQSQEPAPHYAVPAPTARDYAETERDIEEYGMQQRRRPTPKPKAPGGNGNVLPGGFVDFNESVKRNPVLNEAYQMMNAMHKKIENIFYRYGMSGLEKINNSMEEVFENIVNPQYVEPEPRIVERVVEVPVEQPAPKPKRRIVKKKPTQKRIVREAVEPVVAPVVMPKETDEEIMRRASAKFEQLGNAMDDESLGDCLIEQDETRRSVPSKVQEQLKNIEARAAMLQKTMEQKKEETQTEIEENFEQSQELEVVDVDGDDNLLIDDPIADAELYEENAEADEFEVSENLTEQTEENEEEI